jgi:hypothetical protein
MRPLPHPIPSGEHHAGRSLWHQPRAVAPVNRPKPILVRLCATKEVEDAYSVRGSDAERLGDKDAAHAVAVPLSLPPDLVRGEHVLPTEAIEHSDDRAVATRHNRDGAATHVRTTRQPGMEGELLEAE